MNGNTLQRNDNLKRILKEVQTKGPVSKRSLQEITGFSWGNISSLTNYLIDNKFITISGKQSIVTGRKPDELDINTEDNLILTVEIYTQKITLNLCDLKGRVIESNSFDYKYDSLLDYLLESVQKILNSYNDKKIYCITISSDNASEYAYLKNELENKFDLETFIYNTTDCIFNNELFYGSLKEKKPNNAVLFRINSGIDMSMFLNGNVNLYGNDKNFSVGTMVVPYNKSLAYLKDVIGEDAVSKKHFSNESCKFIANMAKSGDREAIGIFSNVGKSFGFCLNNIISTLSPEKIILCGSFTEYCDLFLPYSLEVLKEMIGNNTPEIIVSELKMNSSVGAALFSAIKIIDTLIFS